MTAITLSESETRLLAKNLANRLKNAVICLYGDLGSGKTTFIRGLAAGIGVNSAIQSPTFTYNRIYEGRKKLYHFDLYRVAKPDVLLLSELNEILERADGIIAIEWAQNLSKYLPEGRIDIHFKMLENDKREIRINYDRSTN